MSDFPHDIMATASWVAAHRLDLSKEAGQQIVSLIAHSLNDERTKSAARIAALEAENERLRSQLARIEDGDAGLFPDAEKFRTWARAVARDALEAKP